MVWQALIPAAASIIGGAMSSSSTRAAGAANAAAQREFAQHGIRWKVRDARLAGLHPLAALGAQTTSFAPSYVGDNLGASFAQAGQDLGRAFQATRTSEERTEAEAVAYGRQNQLSNLAIERARLENDLLRSRIARENAQIGPPMPTVGASPPAYVPGGPNHVAGPGLRIGAGSAPAVGAITIEPEKITSRSPQDTSTSAGSSPAWSLVEALPGQHVYLPSQATAEKMEPLGPAAFAATVGKNAIESARWLGRKFTGGTPPSLPLPKGYAWRWSVLDQAWQPFRR